MVSVDASITQRGKVTTADVIELWFNLDLRQHVIDTAKDLTKQKSIQAKLLGKAWFILGEAKPQKTIDFYAKMCSQEMIKERDRLFYSKKHETFFKGEYNALRITKGVIQLDTRVSKHNQIP